MLAPVPKEMLLKKGKRGVLDKGGKRLGKAAEGSQKWSRPQRYRQAQEKRPRNEAL